MLNNDTWICFNNYNCIALIAGLLTNTTFHDLFDVPRINVTVYVAPIVTGVLSIHTASYVAGGFLDQLIPNEE